MSVALPKPIRVFVTGAGGRTGQLDLTLRVSSTKTWHANYSMLKQQPCVPTGRLVFNKLKSRPEQFAPRGLVR